jgi:tetratricopeptide (TPR) repeat protein
MYASPAQLSGLVSMTDDWWSLGMIVQESLLGRHPHAGKSPAEIQRSYVTQEFRPQVPRAVSDRWKPLLEGLLDYDPEKRWSDEAVLRWCEGGLVRTSSVGAGGAVGETVGWLKRAWLFLEDGEFESAKEYAERVLDREPATGEAYWVKALAGFGVRNESDLGNRQEPLSGDRNYQKALRFGTAELKRRLEGLEADIQRRISEDHRRKEGISKKSKATVEKRRRKVDEARQRVEDDRLAREHFASVEREAEECQEAEAEAKTAKSRGFDLAVEKNLDWIRTLLQSLDLEEEEKAKLWLKQADWNVLKVPLETVRHPENWGLIRLNANLCPIIDQPEWTYREAVALCIWASSRRFKQFKESERAKRPAIGFTVAIISTGFCLLMFCLTVAVAIEKISKKESVGDLVGIIFTFGFFAVSSIYQIIINFKHREIGGH